MTKGEKNMTALIAELEARISLLEAGPNLAKLSLSPGDLVVVKSKDHIDISVLKSLANGISDGVGFKVSVIHVEGDREIGVFKKAML
jgi:hypothetical protein